MDPITQQTALATAGGKKDPLYVDDVFSTYLWDGTGSAQTFNNGIDLAGEGGLVWSKFRGLNGSQEMHELVDSERGKTGTYYDVIHSNNSNAQNTSYSWGINAFNNNGFSVNGNNQQFNGSGDEGYVSWTLRKAPGFFDVVTYTGNGTVRQIAHNLGSVPGMIIVKDVTNGGNWEVYHRSIGNEVALRLNLTNAAGGTTVWNDTTPTSTHFTVGTSGNINASGSTFVAYIFAHDDQSFGTDSDEAIIKCGSYTGTGTAGNTVDLGFEPQFVILKSAVGGTGDWRIIDNMRGFATGANCDATLNANTNEAELPNYDFAAPTATGFTLKATSGPSNASGRTYIYMAIRRPHKPPEAGTEVFDPVTYTGNGTSNTIANSLLHTDSTWIKRRTSSDRPVITDRLRYTNYLATDRDDGENTWSTNDQVRLDSSYSTKRSGNATGYNNSPSQPYISWNFKRAPGFFDVVAFTGTASATTVNHNLEAIPELVIIKNRETNNFWSVYVSSLSSPRTKILILSGDDQAGTSAAGTYWGNSDFTSTQISVGGFANTNGNNQGMIAYLFATLPGVSKVGSYSGTGSNIGVDCGFTAGARFVLIKRTDSAGDWYVWDTTRGIVGGNDPYLLLNNDAAQVTNKDYIDPLNSGFTVTSSAIADLNTSGGNYIFLAIA